MSGISKLAPNKGSPTDPRLQRPNMPMPGQPFIRPRPTPPVRPTAPVQTPGPPRSLAYSGIIPLPNGDLVTSVKFPGGLKGVTGSASVIDTVPRQDGVVRLESQKSMEVVPTLGGTPGPTGTPPTVYNGTSTVQSISSRSVTGTAGTTPETSRSVVHDALVSGSPGVTSQPRPQLSRPSPYSTGLPLGRPRPPAGPPPGALNRGPISDLVQRKPSTPTVNTTIPSTIVSVSTVSIDHEGGAKSGVPVELSSSNKSTTTSTTNIGPIKPVGNTGGTSMLGNMLRDWKAKASQGIVDKLESEGNVSSLNNITKDSDSTAVTVPSTSESVLVDEEDDEVDTPLRFDPLRPQQSWPPPPAPALLASTPSSLSLQWTVPQKNIQRFELQLRVGSNGAEDSVTSESDSAVWVFVSSTIKSNRWTVKDLRSGAAYRFRVRFRKLGGWSLFSAPSDAFVTESGRSVTLLPPHCVSSTLNSISLRWPQPTTPTSVTVLCVDLGSASKWQSLLEPTTINGKPTLPTAVYSLTTLPHPPLDSDAVIYSGTSTACKAVNLRPHRAYGFRFVQGDSEPSDIRVCCTPTPPTGVSTRQIQGGWTEWWSEEHEAFYFVSDAGGEIAWQLPAYLNKLLRRFGRWGEYWDVATQHVFYYNADTRERSWDPPVNSIGDGSCLLDPNEGTSTAVLSPDEMLFRRRRFELLWAARDGTIPPGSVVVDVSRDNIVGDSLAALKSLKKQDIQRQLEVHFRGEAGVDVGGLTKEWCLLFSRQVQAATYKLFRPTPANDGTLDIHAFVPSSQRALFCMRLIGRFVGKAVFDRQLIDLPLSHCVCLRILGKSPTLDDLKIHDPEMAQGLSWMLANDITGIVDYTFSVLREVDRGPSMSNSSPRKPPPPSNRPATAANVTTTIEGTGGAGGETRDVSDVGNEDEDEDTASPSRKPQAQPVYDEVDLIPDGSNVEVTEENKAEYVNKMLDWRSGGECSIAIAELSKGIFDVLPLDRVQEFTVAQFQSLLGGQVDVDVGSLARTCVYTDGLTTASPHVVWFWECFDSLSPQLKQAVLKFVCGTERVPLDGLEPPFTLTGTSKPVDSLPVAHTCFNQLVLPSYPTKEILREKLLYAVTHTAGFELT